ncbi:chromosome partitioning protein ParA [Rhizobium rhizosphaerae]|uniref:Chromosome partitioning protein ParA n=1 Tax=Xaviernesmea rhizosphaerae TaxID=1672749 RepID=A0A1Q9AHI1_9HYPH|nr:ParA family protein [Xaviernesmea rhizosphaerae]OLP54644.1 chromosome partitioning protein ParA [Xaviernesmea rhizosphaerae]
MTILAFAHSKGGVGKSTLCLLIASELAQSGRRVLIIDADQKQQSCLQWIARCHLAGSRPNTLTGEIATKPEDLKRLLRSTDAEIILIDVQGSMNDLLIAAIVASDITLVPTKANVMEMVETVKLFDWAQTNLRRAPLHLVLNRVEGIDTNTAAFQDAVRMIREHQLPALSTFVRARKVYEQFARDAGSLERIGKDPSKSDQVTKARANIVSLIGDITAAISPPPTKDQAK